MQNKEVMKKSSFSGRYFTIELPKEVFVRVESVESRPGREILISTPIMAEGVCLPALFAESGKEGAKIWLVNRRNAYARAYQIKWEAMEYLPFDLSAENGKPAMERILLTGTHITVPKSNVQGEEVPKTVAGLFKYGYGSGGPSHELKHNENDPESYDSGDDEDDDETPDDD